VRFVDSERVFVQQKRVVMVQNGNCDHQDGDHRNADDPPSVDRLSHVNHRLFSVSFDYEKQDAYGILLF
jgi:hypothetical protein